MNSPLNAADFRLDDPRQQDEFDFERLPVLVRDREE